MSEQRVERRLAAIMAADVVGYSRLMSVDEEGTLAALLKLRRELIDPKIGEYRGRIFKTTGDGILAEFQSVLDAVRCAVAFQHELAERNEEVEAGRRIEFRVGLHQGDIIVEDGDIFGDGVNVAARLEALAEPGGICISERVQEDTEGRLDLFFDDLGEKVLKNIGRPVRIFMVRSANASIAARLSKGIYSTETNNGPSIGSFLGLCLVLVALVTTIVIYIMCAKILGIFLSRFALCGIWIAVIFGWWLAWQVASRRRNSRHRREVNLKLAAGRERS